MKRILAISCCLLFPVALSAQVLPPEGWRFPDESDYADDWIEYRETYPVPFHAQGDFNGDGLTDDAWIVISKTGDFGGLCVFLAETNAPPKIIWLDKGSMVYKPQWVGISAVPPGKYKTACGKGYFKCESGKPKELDLKIWGQISTFDTRPLTISIGEEARI